jgi:hypothetical protein
LAKHHGCSEALALSAEDDHSGIDRPSRSDHGPDSPSFDRRFALSGRFWTDTLRSAVKKQFPISNNLELRGRPIKAHYGVRVLRNAGDWKFVEVLFERLDGAMDVAAGDFDSNGRIDLAVTAFYPDWRAPVPTTLLLLMQRTDGSVERFGIDDA